MDDIDKTFEKLKKQDFEVLLNKFRFLKVEPGTGRIDNWYIYSGHSILYSLTKKYHQACIDAGWTVKEFNERLNKGNYDY